MFYSLRRRQEAMAAAEADGQSFWTSSFNEATRYKIRHIFNDELQSVAPRVAASAREMLIRAYGRSHLTPAYQREDELWLYLLECPDEHVPDVIEALLASVPLTWSDTRGLIEEELNKVLTQERISFEVSDGKAIPFSSRVMHEAVVRPVLVLLANTSRYGAVEKSFRSSLEEIANDKPENAITDAAAALECMLRELRCEGNSLGPLIKSAKGMGILAPHDVNLVSGLMNWVSADRSEKGDAHGAHGASISDAWLTIHVVGALLLRLADGARSQ